MSRVMKEKPYSVIITGLSGSGKSVALNALEDNGFFCVDNLPVSLMKTFFDLCRKTPTISKVAIGIDIREGRFLADFSRAVSMLRKTQKLEVLFLTATVEILVRRFKETRRPHPLGFKDLKKAIQRESKMLLPIKEEADRVIDTSRLSPHELRTFLGQAYLGRKKKSMAISLVSFGYKYGIPSEADLLFDVRFLPNPNFIEELRAFPGTSAKVKRFVLYQQETRDFLDKLCPLLIHAIPLYKREGRSYLTIGIGCTGGRHRSPAIVEHIRKELKKNKFDISVAHRDMQEG